jgi:type II secretion system protein N
MKRNSASTLFCKFKHSKYEAANHMKRWFFYILYILIATAFFLYYLFPSDAAKDFISAYLAKSQPDYHLQAARIRPVFPPGIKLQTVGISYKKDVWAELERFVVTPDYLTMFSEKKSFSFKGNAYRGDIQGKIDIIPGNPPSVVAVDADIHQIRLDDMERLQEMSGRKVLGNLDGILHYQDGKGLERKADIQISISNCTVEIANPLINIGLDQINFRSVDAVVTIDQQALEVKQCKAMGTQADGELSGVIRFRRPFAKSLLDFRGTVKPHHNLLANLKNMVPGGLFQQKKNESDGFPIKLYGTIEKPKISLR